MTHADVLSAIGTIRNSRLLRSMTTFHMGKYGRIRIVHGMGLLSKYRFGDLYSTKKDLAMGFFIQMSNFILQSTNIKTYSQICVYCLTSCDSVGKRMKGWILAYDYFFILEHNRFGN